jgi:hypothetical protein
MGSILLPLSRSSQGERNMDIHVYIFSSCLLPAIGVDKMLGLKLLLLVD